MSFDVFDLLTTDTDAAESIKWLERHGFVPVPTSDLRLAWRRDIGKIVAGSLHDLPVGLSLFAEMNLDGMFSVRAWHNGMYMPSRRNNKVEDAFKTLCDLYPLDEWIRERLPKEIKQG